MTTELKILAWSILFGLLQVLIAGGMATRQRGIKWNRQNSSHTALGSQIYLGARVCYFPIYVAGIPYLRTFLFAVSL